MLLCLSIIDILSVVVVVPVLVLLHRSSTTRRRAPSAADRSSDSTTRSASAPSSRQPLTPRSPSMAAGVDVTALSACGMLAPDQFRKFDTHSTSVMELSSLERGRR